jgi:hypothetical protein
MSKITISLEDGMITGMMQTHKKVGAKYYEAQ